MLKLFNTEALIPRAFLVCVLIHLILLSLPHRVLADEPRQVDQFTLEPLAAQGEFSLVLKMKSAGEYKLQLVPAELFSSIQTNGSDTLSNVQVYSGHLTGSGNSWARITISDDVLFGLIDSGGERFEVYSSAARSLKGAPVANKARSIRSGKAYQHGVVNSLSSGKPYSRVLPVAIVVDHLYDQAYSGNGLVHAISVINGVDGIYRQELGLAVKLEVAIYVDSEPFSELPGASPAQLYSFRSFRQQLPELQGELAMVHLFSGSELPTHSEAGVGYAYIGTVCDNSGFDISVSAPYHLGSELAAHEMAHNLGAFHDEDTDACSSDESSLMYSVVGGSTKFSTCSVDKIEANLNQSACYMEVHDGSIWLERSGERSVIAHVTSESEFSTVISPVVQFTFNGSVSSMPDYCHALGADSIHCVLPAIEPNEIYQFALEFASGDTNTVVAEYLQGSTHDIDLTNNVSELTLYVSIASAPVRLCVDEDGDGYGWNGHRTCVPVPAEQSVKEIPEFINQVSGDVIYLTNERWSAGDLVDRLVECHAYFYDSVHGKYTRDESSYTRYRHVLDNNGASAGTVEVARFISGSERREAASSVEYLPWELNQGYYAGPAAFSRSSYLQIVSAAGGDNNAIRSYSSDLSFDLCTSFPDASETFRPTGSEGNSSTCIDTYPHQDGWGWNGTEPCQLSVVSESVSISNPTLVINSTQAKINLDGLVGGGEWAAATRTDVDAIPLSFPVSLAGLRSNRKDDSWAVMHDNKYLYFAVVVPDNTPFKDSDLYQHDDCIELFIDGGNQRSRRYDSDDSHLILRATGEVSGTFVPGARVAHVRVYDAQNKQYVYEIQISKQSLQIDSNEFGLDLQINNDQDGGERDAKQGWSGNAGSNTHWFELVTVGSACFDTGPLSARCSGQDQQPATCVDTGVIGDGWGWDGVASCRLDATGLPGVCVESGDVGDGWGWNGVSSCKL